MPMAGQPMLGWLLRRLKASNRVTRLLVATSDRSDDDAVSQYCAGAGVECVRGSLDDVTGRMLAAARSVNARSFVRISGDSPLMDPGLVSAVINLFESEASDLATNVYPRSFPKGFSVEAMRVEALERTRSMLQRGEEEHVTQVFYRCPSSFRIANVASGHDWGGINLSVDTPEDFALTERIIELAGETLDRCGVAELLALRTRCLAIQA